MVNSAFQNNPLCGDRDYRYGRRSGLIDSLGQVRVVLERAFMKGVKELMKKVAIITAAACALALGACNKNNADNNAANETAVENSASTDVNVATENAGAEANADAALNAASNDVANAGAAVNNAAAAVENK